MTIFAIITLILDAILVVGLITYVIKRHKSESAKGDSPNVKAVGAVDNDVALRLENVVKVYGQGDTSVRALKGVSLNFRKSEFVSILGQSGCGKTTMLNIIGGLDRYTSGDMLINGKSTKDFNDRDWDTYRNHSVGFVFQSYNLIPHQTVLQNVELALALSGVSKAERRERAKKALKAVGLDTQFNKKPGEMSGGQMQRVAIARALVNNPDIILADEPTGALDSETSVQVMEILKEVSKDRLVIMVTHNPELADKYSTRIVRMLDGNIVEDTRPLEAAKPSAASQKPAVGKVKKQKKPAMSIWTSFSLSLKNLFTKKGRTMLTSFAGSIGIIGIALIYAVSQGMTTYINHVQETTLASYPLTIEEQSVDLTSLMKSFMNVGKSENDHDKDAIYKEAIITELVNALGKTDTTENDLKSFKSYLENEVAKEDSELSEAVSGIQYTYDMELAVYTRNVDGKIIKSDTKELMTEMIGDYMLGVSTNGGSASSGSASSGGSTLMSRMVAGGGMWQELLPETDGSPINRFLKEQYDVIYGSWPNEYDEVVLVVNENNELDDLTLYALGLLSESEIDAIIDAAVNGTELDYGEKSWSYKEICDMTFRTVLPADRYVKDGNVYKDISKTESGLALLYESALKLKVTGIIRPSDNADSPMLSSGIGYTSELTEYVINKAKESDVVKDQIANPGADLLSEGLLPFKSTTGTMSDAEKEAAFREYIGNMTESQKAQAYTDIKSIIPKETLKTQTDSVMRKYTDKDALSETLANAMAEQMGIGAETFKNAFADMELEDLQAIMRPFVEEQVKAKYAETVGAQLSAMSESEKAAALDAEMPTYSTEQCALYYDEITVFSDSSYEDNLVKLGCLDLDSPSSISIYASTFESKDIIEKAISDYNQTVEESKRIQYTDYVGLMMSSVTTIINAVTYVLIAFVAVSLVVSSIMIGVITLISVQERTKEIGILRAIGASKRNVSTMFNAETLIIGFSSGAFGVILTYLLCIPINIILHVLTGIGSLSAYLPPVVALILIAISMLLTLFAGIIPSRSAAKKDPVVALRTE